MCFGSTQTQVGTQAQGGESTQLNTSSSLGLQAGTSSVGLQAPSYLAGLNQQGAQSLQQIMARLQGMQGASPYGAQQQANYQQQVNQQMQAAQKNASQQLASSGALNSARAGQVATGIQTAGSQQVGNYLAQVPALNASYQEQLLNNQAQIASAEGSFQPSAAGTVSGGTSLQQQLANALGFGSNTSSGTSSSQTTTQQNPLGAILGGLLNAGMGFLTGGLSNLAGGKSFLGNTPSVQGFQTSPDIMSNPGVSSAYNNIPASTAPASSPVSPGSIFTSAPFQGY